MMPTCAIYARVSTDKQGESVDHQISFLHDFAKRKGKEWMVDDNYIYRDDGISGTTMVKRPAVQQLIRDAKRGNFDVILFKGISRFSRNLVDAIHMLEVLRGIGVRVISFEENFDSKHTENDFMFTIHAAVAQHESEKIAIRVRVGQFELAKQGKWVKGPPPIGYDLDSANKKLIVNPAESKIVRLIYDCYVNKGMGMKVLAQYLNERGYRTKRGNQWTSVTVRRVIINKAYIGTLVYGENINHMEVDEDNPTDRRKVRKKNPNDSEVVTVENTHEAIVSKEIFNRAQTIIMSRQVKSEKGVNHLLTGLLICPVCGDSMIAQVSRVRLSDGEFKHYLYYTCKTKFRYGRSTCNSENINGNWIQRIVINYVVKIAREYKQADKNAIRARLTGSVKVVNTQDLIKQVENKIGDIQNQMVNANMKNGKGIIDDETLFIIMKELKETKLTLESERRLLEARAASNNTLDAIDEYLDAIDRAERLDKIFEIDSTEARTLLMRIVKRVTVQDKKVNIKLAFPIKTLLTNTRLVE